MSDRGLAYMLGLFTAVALIAMLNSQCSREEGGQPPDCTLITRIC